jgi:Holliday junction resolvase RusA-like endonuclease
VKVAFVVPGPPVPWERSGVARNGRHYTQPRSEAAQELIKMCATVAAYRLKEPWNARAKRYGIRLFFWLPDERTRDWDNLAKQVTDALNKVMYADDNRIFQASVGKDIDRLKPRTEVELEVLVP